MQSPRDDRDRDDRGSTRRDDRSLTICDITQAFAETSGGIKTYLLRKRRYLLDRTPHRHVLIIPGAEDRVEHDGRATTVSIAAPEIRGYEPYRFILRVDKVVRALADLRPDVIELGSPYILPWAAFRHRRRHRECAVLGYYHTDYPEAYVGATMRRGNLAPLAGISVRLAEWYARLVHRRFDRTLTGSPALRAALERLGIEAIGFVPLGVDAETFHPRAADRSVWRRFGLDPARPVLIFAGRLDHEKRVQVLVDALARLEDRPDLQLALVGEGPSRRELERRAETDPRLHVLPYQKEPHQLARLLASADLYVTAGPHETFGLSVVEAQACGLPVVGVRAGALIERVPPEVGRLGRADDPEEFAANLHAILGEDLPAIGARARELVIENFTWERTFDRLLEAYREEIDARVPESAGASRSRRSGRRERVSGVSGS